MPAWLFSRGRRKRSMSDAKKHALEQASPVLTADAQGLARRNSRTHKRKKRRKASLDSPTQKEKLAGAVYDAEKQPLALPPPQLPLHPPAHGKSVEDIAALPVSPILPHSPHLRPVVRDVAQIPYNLPLNADSRHGLPSTGSLPLGTVTASPHDSLNNMAAVHQDRSRLRKSPPPAAAANSSSMGRRKSSRRRKDPVREEEIRAMSAPLPVKRPAAYSAGPLRRDSKKMRHGLNRHFERPTSDISLPMEESLHSSISSTSDQRAYTVIGLDLFSARPKIRYTIGAAAYNSTSHTPIWEQMRSDSARKERNDVSHLGRRIGDLAEDMDASSLREIMERDRRRKEKKRRQDEERLLRRLERRAEKQRREPETGVLTPKRSGQGLIGLGIEQPHPSTRPIHPLEREAAEAEAAAAAAAAAAATATAAAAIRAEEEDQDTAMLLDHHDHEEDQEQKHTPRHQLPTPEPEPEPEPEPAHIHRESQGTPPVQQESVHVHYAPPSPPSPPSPPQPNHTRVASTISQLPALASELTPPSKPAESPEPQGKKERRSSEHSSRRMRIWASLFRRGTSSKRTSLDQANATPSASDVSFSNTSRESMSRQPLPAHLASAPAPSVFTRRASGTPARTRSKFREDLPEFPHSPPDSRVQSPKVQAMPATQPIPIPARRGHRRPADIETDPDAMVDVSYGESSADPHDSSPASPPAESHHSGGTGFVSQSLASVDSEGSWLSGKPMKRRSNQTSSYMKHSSVGSTIRQKDDFNPSYEELGIPDDEYFRRLTDDRHRSAVSGVSGVSGIALQHKASSAAMGVSDSEDTQTERADDREVLHSGLGRTPTVVHAQPHPKSREGLLNEFIEGESAIIDTGDESGHKRNGSSPPDSPLDSPEPEVTLQRATSVDLGKKNSRTVSVGSPRLLDIPAKRSSRTSVVSETRGAS